MYKINTKIKVENFVEVAVDGANEYLHLFLNYFLVVGANGNISVASNFEKKKRTIFSPLIKLFTEQI